MQSKTPLPLGPTDSSRVSPTRKIVRTSPRRTLELLAGEEASVHVGEGDVEKERFVGVVFDETNGVVYEKRAQVVVTVRLLDDGGVVVQKTQSRIRAFIVELHNIQMIR